MTQWEAVAPEPPEDLSGAAQQVGPDATDLVEPAVEWDVDLSRTEGALPGPGEETLTSTGRPAAWDLLGASRLIGLQGRLGRPFWGLLGMWSVLCGALASNQGRWTAEDLTMLIMTVLLAELAWGSAWDLATGVDWQSLLRGRQLPGAPVEGRAETTAWLPYTQRKAPAGRLSRWLRRRAERWRGIFWPAAGPALLGLVAAGMLATVLTLLLPARLWPLEVALVVLVVLGSMWRAWGRSSLAGQAVVQVGLGWLAGHLAYSAWDPVVAIVAVVFAIAAWGVLRLGQGRARGVWLLNGGQAVAALALVWLGQAAMGGAIGLLLAGQTAMQSGGRPGRMPVEIGRRSWGWLMVAMAVAALGLRLGRLS